MDFEPESVQLKQMYEVYNITDHLYAYVWMPMSDNVFFIQPYIHNFYFNQFTGYFYNLLTSQYSFKETASPSSAVTSSSTASVLATTSLLASDALRMVS
ncbi:hypothetical protein [Thermogymnomonas acidicola]|nr:hypothetical protein [Thermogymnomonas acidicola]